MKLTTDNVTLILTDCLYKDGEDTSNHVATEGVVRKFGFNPDKLKEHREDIISMLDQLPDNFKENKGGGWSFLNACITEDGDQWGEHSNIEELICLGMGIGAVKYMMPRSLWKIFPGGMPYFSINTEKQSA